MKKVFTKLDWQWEHKNVLINAGDKWMMAFMTLEGSFEPTVMSFGLTNSLAIFQTMMNKILWSLNQYWGDGKFYWKCNCGNRRGRGTWQSSRGDGKKAGRKWFVYKTGEV